MFDRTKVSKTKQQLKADILYDLLMANVSCWDRTNSELILNAVRPWTDWDCVTGL